MTTLLLTFFVLLLSMGHIRDETLFDQGQQLPLFFLQGVKAGFGFKEPLDFGNAKAKHLIDNPELPQGTTLDAKQERIKRLIRNVSRSMKTSPSQLKAERISFSVTSITFRPGQAVLDESATQYLSRFCQDLQQNADPAGIMLYVLGLAGSEATEQQQWMLSAQRAQAAAKYLQTAFQGRWQVYWWGAGPGGDWVGRDSPISQDCQVLIAVLKAGN